MQEQGVAFVAAELECVGEGLALFPVEPLGRGAVLQVAVPALGAAYRFRRFLLGEGSAQPCARSGAPGAQESAEAHDLSRAGCSGRRLLVLAAVIVWGAVGHGEPFVPLCCGTGRNSPSQGCRA